MTPDQPPARPDSTEPHYRPCRACPRCTSGTGRAPTRQQDCWDVFLTGAVSALAERRRRERCGEEQAHRG